MEPTMKTRTRTTFGLTSLATVALCGPLLLLQQPLSVSAQESGGANSQFDSFVPAVFAPTMAPSSVPPTPAFECPLKCANGGICKLGEHDYSDHPTEPNGASMTFLRTTNRQGWYCECPPGFTGLRCNREYVMCPVGIDLVTGRMDDLGSGNTSSSFLDEDEDEDDTEDVLAGSPHYCYHGGQCLAGLTDDARNSQRFCDCSKAKHNGAPYFGKYCEIQGAVRCSKDEDDEDDEDDDSQVFCTAQGTCVDKFEKHSNNPCNCPEGFTGPHCEFLEGTVPECSLSCGRTIIHNDYVENNGTDNGVGSCRLGMKDFESARYRDFWSEHDGNYQYCKCPPKWFGDNCEVPGISCGNAHCFNGATCVESLSKDGEISFACDCREANRDGKSWAGQYCENPETDSCNPSDGNIYQEHANGHLFCTNGGTCKDPHNPHLGCNCPADQYGPACEYHSAEDDTCSLTCQNGGQCRAGRKDNSLIEKLGKGMKDFNATHHSELFEHCICPHNYFGVQCEHRLEICPGGDHVCLHGSKCVAHDEGENADSTYYTCDCDSAFDALDKYAGKFCQYQSTDICTTNGQPGMGKANFAFCVNNGICKGRVRDGEDPPGCDCPEGFEGDHCEYLIVEEDDEFSAFGIDHGSLKPPPRRSSGESLVVGLSAVVVVLVAFVIGLVVRALLYPELANSKSKANVQAALDEEERGASSSSTASCAADTVNGVVVPRSDSGDGSLEDVDIADYVNNNGSVLSQHERNNVQVV